MRTVALLILAGPSPCCDVAQAVTQAGFASRAAAAVGSKGSNAADTHKDAAMARPIGLNFFFVTFSSLFARAHLSYSG